MEDIQQKPIYDDGGSVIVENQAMLVIDGGVTVGLQIISI